MDFLHTTNFHINNSQRKTRSLYNWLAKVTGVEACWIEGVNSEDKPVWAFIKRLAKTPTFFVRSSIFRKVTAASLFFIPLFFIPQQVAMAQSSVNLSALQGTDRITLNGIDEDDKSGGAVASGDINGDGIDDLIIGARYANISAGETFVIFGTTTAFTSSVDLSSLNGATGFVLNGIDEDDSSGGAVASGDINGDGIDDLIIGAPFAHPNANFYAGETYVVFGKTTAFSSSVDLSSLNGATGFVLNGIDAEDESGVSVASGDINDDGIDDVIIGAISADPNANENAGETYVVFGKTTAFSSSVDLSSLNGATGFVLNGIDDLIIGARFADPNANSGAGETYVVFGKTTAFTSSVELSSLNGATGFVLNGIDQSDKSGNAVASGDINGDGIDDLVIGAYFADPNANYRSGETYVMFGKTTAFSSSVDLSSLNGTTGFVLNGIDESDISGFVLTSGDINGDGIDDLVIGASGADPNANSNAGETYVVFGKTTAFTSSVELSSLNGATGFVLNGIDQSDNSGSAVASGDINGDGIDDLVIGAGNADPNANNKAGETYVYFAGAQLKDVQAGRSILFDGTNDLLSVADSDAFDNLGTMTVEAWINSNDTSTRQGIIEKHVTPSSGWWIDLNTDITVALVSSGGSRAASSTVNPQNNTWHHVAVVYNGTDIIIYLDGMDVTGTNSGSGSGTIQDNTNALQIGDLNWTSANFNGLLDEVRVWNTARTQQDIQNNMFQPLGGTESGLIGYWPLNNGIGNIATDKTTNNNTAVLTDGADWDSDTHPFGTIVTGDEGWRMLASPFRAASYAILLERFFTQGFTGADTPNETSNVYTWDEVTRQFISVSNASDIPVTGTGFISYIFSDDAADGAPEGFPKVVKIDSTQNINNVSPTLSFTDTGDNANDGFNLVGNPYGEAIDWDVLSGFTRSNLDATFYVWSDSANAGAGSYLTWNGATGTLTSGLISPWQGFWVKANATSPSLSITTDARSTGSVFMKQKQHSELRFTLNGSQFASRAIVFFDQDAKLNQDDLDAYKLESLNSSFLSLFTKVKDGAPLEINAIPENPEEVIELGLDFTGDNIEGEYRLSWEPSNIPDDLSFILVDNQNGEKVILNEQTSYDFEVRQPNAGEVMSGNGVTPFYPPEPRVLSPQVLKTKNTSGSRFTLHIVPGNVVVNTEEPSMGLPSETELDQNYPNPFNPSTNINFTVPEQAVVRLEVFDLLGRKVATLINAEDTAAGRYQVLFDASALSSGVYVYRLQVGNRVLTRKMSLIK